MALEKLAQEAEAFLKKQFWRQADKFGRYSHSRERAFKNLDKFMMRAQNRAYLRNIKRKNRFADRKNIKPDYFNPMELIKDPVPFFKKHIDNENVEFIQNCTNLDRYKKGLDQNMEIECSWNSLLKSGWKENDQVKAKMILPPNATSLVISCNGYREPSFFFHEEMTKKLIDQGVAVLYFPMPFHMNRTPKRTKNGALMINNEMERNIGFPQAVQDIFTILKYSNFDYYGIIGVSLGAILGAEYTFLKIKEHNQKTGDDFPEIDVSVPIIGGGNVPNIAENSVLFKALSSDLIEQNKPLLQGYDPNNVDVKTPVTDMYPLFALYDTIVPIKNGEELKKRFEIPDKNCMWFPVGHKSIFLQQKEISDFIPAVMMPYFNGQMKGNGL